MNSKPIATNKAKKIEPDNPNQNPDLSWDFQTKGF
jgi:hypothetical protein